MSIPDPFYRMLEVPYTLLPAGLAQEGDRISGVGKVTRVVKLINGSVHIYGEFPHSIDPFVLDMTTEIWICKP